MSGTILDANATSFSELEADLQTANGETTAGTYTIDVSGTIGLTGVLPEIDLAGGVVLDIVGANGAALDGGASEAGFFVYAGNVSIDDLTLEHMLIQGGNGQTGGGGGGAGLGGGLFVGSQAAVTLDKVSFSSDQALGGNGGAGATNATGGHGGITRAGIGTGGRGGSYSGNLNGGSGQFGGGGGGGVGSKPSTLFLSRTTHGAIYEYQGPGYPAGYGGAGGFGAGAGSAGQAGSPPVASRVRYTSGFFTYTRSGQQGDGGRGGGGLGAGGDIFVQSGGSLKILGGSLSYGVASGGTGAYNGDGAGSGIFIQGDQTLTLAPTATETLIIDDTITDEAGTGNSVSAGTLAINGAGVVVLGAENSFLGGVVLENGDLVLDAPSAAGSGPITFENTTTSPILSFTVADAPANTIYGFGAGDTIDIIDLLESSITETFTPDSSGGGTLTLSGTQIASGAAETVDVVFGDYSGPFTYQPSTGAGGRPDGGTEITQPLCYLRGTLILTPNGRTPIEDIAIGDMLVTRFGGLRPVKWIGRQSYDWRFARKNPAKCPVRIRAGALGQNMPARDLLISPGHSVLVGNCLLLAEALVNGVNIVHEPAPACLETAPPIEYFNIEFETHDCVLAEGVFSESFAEAAGLRAQFHNAADFHARYPAHVPLEELQLCAPRPERGADLAEALAPHVARATAGIRPGTLQGNVDLVEAHRIDGWALDVAHPHLPVLLEILHDGEVIGTILSCDPRADLRDAGKGLGRCAFFFETSVAMTGKIVARRAADGAELRMNGDVIRLAA